MLRSLMAKSTVDLTRGLFSIAAALLPTFTFAAPPAVATADGKTVKAWLAAAAVTASAKPVAAGGGFSPDQTIDPFLAMNAVAEAQVSLGDTAGAAKTAATMEQMLDHEPKGGMLFETHEYETLSADLAAGRSTQAERLLQQMAASPTMVGPSRPGEVPANLTPYLARAGRLMQALDVLGKQPNSDLQLNFYFMTAWAEFVMKRDADSDRVCKIINRQLAATSKIDWSRLQDFAKLLALRGQYDAALSILDKADSPNSAGDWPGLLLICNDAGDSKAVKSLADLMLARSKKLSDLSPPQQARLACTMAEAGALDDAKALMQQITSAPNGSEDGAVKRFVAELAVWTHAPQAAAPMAPASSPTRARRSIVQQSIDLESTDRMIHALTHTDDLPHAEALVQSQARGSDTALLQLIECEARNGQSAAAIEHLKKLTAHASARGAELLARGWARAADSKGLTAWIDLLEVPLVKYSAQVGVAEGLSHTTVRDIYSGPPSHPYYD